MWAERVRSVLMYDESTVCFCDKSFYYLHIVLWGCMLLFCFVFLWCSSCSVMLLELTVRCRVGVRMGWIASYVPPIIPPLLWEH